MPARLGVLHHLLELVHLLAEVPLAEYASRAEEADRM